MVANNEACPEPATGLFVSGAEEDHSSLQFRIRSVMSSIIPIPFMSSAPRPQT
jgi:hypothetical protein